MCVFYLSRYLLVFFPLLFASSLLAVFFPFIRAQLGSSVISITTLYATLIIVGVMSSRKSSKMRPRRISTLLSPLLTPRYYPSVVFLSLSSSS